jgi:hypothetical protein
LSAVSPAKARSEEESDDVAHGDDYSLSITINTLDFRKGQRFGKS